MRGTIRARPPAASRSRSCSVERSYHASGRTQPGLVAAALPRCSPRDHGPPSRHRGPDRASPGWRRPPANVRSAVEARTRSSTLRALARCRPRSAPSVASNRARQARCARRRARRRHRIADAHAGSCWRTPQPTDARHGARPAIGSSRCSGITRSSRPSSRAGGVGDRDCRPRGAALLVRVLARLLEGGRSPVLQITVLRRPRRSERFHRERPHELDPFTAEGDG